MTQYQQIDWNSSSPLLGDKTYRMVQAKFRAWLVRRGFKDELEDFDRLASMGGNWKKKRNAEKRRKKK